MNTNELSEISPGTLFCQSGTKDIWMKTGVYQGSGIGRCYQCFNISAPHIAFFEETMLQMKYFHKNEKVLLL